MAHITRIKAKDSAPIVKEPAKSKPKKEPKDKKEPKKETKEKKPFILFRPFVALGRYLRDSWRELRQVRWPNRKMTWKMVLAVFVYTVIFALFLIALDLLFEWIFSLVIK